MKDLRSQPEPTPEHYLTNADEIQTMIDNQKEIIDRQLEDIKTVLGDDWLVNINVGFSDELHLAAYMICHELTNAIHFAVRHDKVEVFRVGRYAEYHNDLQLKLNAWLGSTSLVTMVKT